MHRGGKKIGGEECDYILRHLEAVDALIACKDRAMHTLGKWLSREIEQRLNALTKDKHRGCYRWEVKEMGDAVNFYDPGCWKEDSPIGFTFGIGGLSFQSVVAGEGEKPCVFYYLDLSEKLKKKPNVAAWMRKVQTQFGHVGKVEGDCLNRQEMDNILNLNNLLRDPDRTLDRCVGQLANYIAYLRRKGLIQNLPTFLKAEM